jgi:hypothetical protein
MNVCIVKTKRNRKRKIQNEWRKATKPLPSIPLHGPRCDTHPVRGQLYHTCMVVESVASGLGKGGEPSTSTEHRGSVNTAVSCNINNCDSSFYTLRTQRPERYLYRCILATSKL